MRKYGPMVAGVGLFLSGMAIIWFKSGILWQYFEPNYANFDESYLTALWLTIAGIFLTFLDGIVGKRILVALPVCFIEAIVGLFTFFIVNVWLSMLAG